MTQFEVIESLRKKKDNDLTLITQITNENIDLGDKNSQLFDVTILGQEKKPSNNVLLVVDKYGRIAFFDYSLDKLTPCSKERSIDLCKVLQLDTALLERGKESSISAMNTFFIGANKKETPSHTIDEMERPEQISPKKR